MNLPAFYDGIREKIPLTVENVSGFDRVLTYAEKMKVALQSTAYILATAYWESDKTMQPVREAYRKDEKWRKKNLRYYPWYGRGLVQTTWEDNYRKVAVAMGLPEDTFLKNPDLLLKWEYALPALFVGMKTGLYTGKKLVDYIDDVDESDTEDFREYVNARRIVNGTDKAETIANLALVFEHALTASGYGGAVVEHRPAEPVSDQPKKRSLWTWLLSLFKRK